VLEVQQLPGFEGGPWRVQSEQSLQAATGEGLNQERLSQQLGRLGGTPWRLETLAVELPEALFLPLTQLNQMRRDLVDLLAGASPAAEPQHRDLSRDPQQTLRQLLAPVPSLASPAEAPCEPRLSVLVRELHQLEALRELPVHRVIADLEHPAQLREAVKRGRGIWPGGIWLAGARITRPDEAWSLEPIDSG